MSGASAAAADILSSLGSPALFDPKTAPALVDGLVAPDAKDALASLASPLPNSDPSGITAAITAGEPIVARNVIAAWRVTSYSDVRASVDLWVDGLLGTPAIGHITSAWQTTTLGLEWDSDGWRLASLTSTPGPSPADATQTPTTYGDAVIATNGMKGWTYAPGS